MTSSPCENFSVFGMKHFFPDPPYPTLGIELFNDTREKFEESSIPFVMENVRSAQQFLGKSVHHCGPFHLWGNAVPPLMPQGIVKTKRRIQLCRCLPDNQYRSLLKEGKTRAEISVIRNAYLNAERRPGDRSQKLKETAEIPPELANCVADYAERLLEQRRCA
jgi:hypothetical protein